ncbi:MAG: bacteriohemerythrin [Actinomycetota bacterium]
MPLLQWNEGFSVGIADLDEDHRSLFALLNELWLAAEQRQENDALRATLKRVCTGMDAHFAREEKHLQHWGYPRLARHVDEHRRLRSSLASLLDRVESGNLASLDWDAFDFIGQWLTAHILKSDADYAAFIADGASDRQRLTGGAAPGLPLRHVWRIVVLGAVASLALGWLVLRAEQASSAARFHELAHQRIVAVKASIDIANDSVSLIVGHFATTPAGMTTRADFRRMVEPTLTAHRFIQAFSWDPLVRQADRPAFEAAIRKDGADGFVITERDPEGRSRPAASRPEYVPITYIEPQASNMRAVGFDLASDPVRKAALDKGRDAGRPQVTARIKLVQEVGNQYGVLVLAPVFDDVPGDDVAARRRALAGYVSGVFRLGDLISESAAELAGQPQVSAQVLIHLFDRSAPADSRQLFPVEPEEDPDLLTRGLHAEMTFEVAGRTWQLVATPASAAAGGAIPFSAIAALTIGLMATAFFAYHQKTGAERMANSARFAREIARAKQQLSEAHRVARLGFVEFEPASGLWRVGEGTQEMLGLEPGCTSGTADEVFANFDPEDRANLLEGLAGDGACPLDIDLRIGDRVLSAVGQAAGAPGGPRVLTFQDITQRRAAERERAAMIARMAEVGRLESLGVLAGGVAHEINTPAQFIGDNLEFIKDWLPKLLAVVKDAGTAAETGDWQPVAERAGAIRYDFAARELPAAAEQSLAGIARISSIVQAIREFSYPSGKTPQPFDLNRAIQTAGIVTRNQWKYVAELVLDPEPNLPHVVGIEGEINQVLVNMILNAAQAIEEKNAGELGRIDIATRLSGDFVELSVADTGAGILPEHLDKLFDLFFTTKPPGKGTGQGLALSKAIILRHGGTITVASEPGKGACFRVRLPLAGPEPAEAAP